jgi:hypothetical protein
MRLLRLLRKQDGISLVMAVGILGVLSLAGVTLVEYASSTARSASYSSHNVASYSVGEAGTAEAFAVLFQETNNPLNPYLLAERTSTYEEGTVTWKGVLDESVSPATWTITSTGKFKNPTGVANDVARTVTAKVRVLVRHEQPNATQVWNYVYVYGTTAVCDLVLQNSTTFSSPLYVAGDGCLYNQAALAGGPFQVHGTMTFNGSNGIGTSSSYVTTGVHIAGGCINARKNLPLHSPCTTEDNVYANPAADTSPITLPTPTPAWDAWYLNASPGPYYPCYTQAGMPPTFDNDQGSPTAPSATKRNRSVPGTFTLTPTTSYTCKTSGGELSWNNATTASAIYGPAKTLTVKGTVFIDGNARVDSGGTITYDGQGTLLLSGSFVLKSTELCAVATSAGDECDWAAWVPNSEMLMIVAGAAGGQSDISTDASISILGSHYQLAMHSAHRLDIGTSSEGSGPMVTSALSIGQSLTLYPFPTITEVPVATPGTDVKFATPQTPEAHSG